MDQGLYGWWDRCGKMRVPDTETAIMKEQEDMRHAENTGLTTWKPEKTLEDMFQAIADSLSNLSGSDDEEVGEDEADDEEDTELSKLGKDDGHGWVMGTISKTVQQCMKCFLQQQMNVDKLTKPGCGDMAHHFSQRDMKYGTAKLIVPAVIKPQTGTTVATPPPTRFGELMQTLDMVYEQSHMPPGTSPPRSNQTEAAFRETTVMPIHSVSPTQRDAQFITE